MVYSLAVMNGGSRSTSKSTRSKASLCLGKKEARDHVGDKREELFLIVSTAKNVSGTKYKVP